MEASHSSQRSLPFSSFSEPRDLWWHRLPRSNYLPPVYACLSDEEWRVLCEWFEATTRDNLAGECGVPLISLLHGLVMGSGIQRIVQLGTAAGYSALLLGFSLRQMNAQRGLFTLEIDETLAKFATNWIDRAGLTAVVHVEWRSSLDNDSVALARDYLGGDPELIFVDSSHEYRQTIAELAAWYPALAPGGFMVLHDTSEFAGGFDVTGEGGVRRAFREWREANREIESMSLNHSVAARDNARMIYQDFCGAGLIQKPL
jgi:predicted O-methyltransferase YrrM